MRLEVSAQLPRTAVRSSCCEQFNLPEQALYRVHGPVNLVRLAQLIDLAWTRRSCCFPPYTAVAGRPRVPPGRRSSIGCSAGDMLMHQPFESFDGVLAFLREAVHDPQVLAIKQTIYRTGTDSALMDLLL